MKISSKRNSSLFLMEFILVLFFFSIAAVCCTRMFVKAWLLSEQASNLSRAENCARNMAEVISGSDDVEKNLLTYFPGMRTEGNEYWMDYDKNWNVCDEKEGKYRLEIVLNSDKNQLAGKITVKDQKEEIYQLNLIKHIPQSLSEESKSWL